MLQWPRKNSLLSNWSSKEGVLDVVVNRVFMLKRNAQAKAALKNFDNRKL